VGVGPVYNYFSSKEMLIAAFMMEYWQQQLDSMAALPKDQPEALLRGVYEALCSYAESHRDLFSDAGAAKAMWLGFAPRHRMLRGQLAGFILPVCKGSNAPFTAAFIAESLISWTMEGTPFDTLYPVIQKLIH
jgi:AcrR family transcriptional regulator